MASRKEQKEAARQRRLAEEQARAERARRDRRLRMLGGTVVGAVLVVVVAIVISSGGSSNAQIVKPTSPAAKKAASTVNALLAGIPQSGNTLGSPNAKVTVTEYGDLVCPVCKSFALGAEKQLISNEVRAGKVKIVYKALETASQTANDAMFVPSQTAALAAGNQKKGWNYIELFYHEQGEENSEYVTEGFLQNIAQQSGVDMSKWAKDRQDPTFDNQVATDAQLANTNGFNGTPSFLIGRSGGAMKKFEYSSLTDPSSFNEAIEALLKA
jgi:protein-disulfide isomerase